MKKILPYIILTLFTVFITLSTPIQHVIYDEQLKELNTESSVELVESIVDVKWENLDLNQQVVYFTNQYRKEKGLEPLEWSLKLHQVAKEKACDMDTNQYFSHEDLSGRKTWWRLESADVKYGFAGENLAKNIYSPEVMVTAWIHSPTHEENLSNKKYKYIGVSVCGEYSAQIFTDKL